MLGHEWRASLVLFCLTITLCSPLSAILSTATIHFVQTPGSLIYEVDNAFSGTLTQMIKAENPSLDAFNDAKLYVPLIENETAHHYALISNMTSTMDIHDF